MKALYTHLDDIEQLKNLAEENIDSLEEAIAESRENLKIWRGLLKLAETCAKLLDEEATETKAGQLRYKWTKQNIQGSKVWTSEVGDVCLKAWGKYVGFPKCLEHLRPSADGDRSTNHMVHRFRKDGFDSDNTDFDTLIDCQLAVEKVHEGWRKTKEKRLGKI